jgi:hypothetical protein
MAVGRERNAKNESENESESESESLGKSESANVPLVTGKSVASGGTRSRRKSRTLMTSSPVVHMSL